MFRTTISEMFILIYSYWLTNKTSPSSHSKRLTLFQLVSTSTHLYPSSKLWIVYLLFIHSLYHKPIFYLLCMSIPIPFPLYFIGYFIPHLKVIVRAYICSMLNYISNQLYFQFTPLINSLKVSSSSFCDSYILLCFSYSLH